MEELIKRIDEFQTAFIKYLDSPIDLSKENEISGILETTFTELRNDVLPIIEKAIELENKMVEVSNLIVDKLEQRRLRLKNIMIDINKVANQELTEEEYI